MALKSLVATVLAMGLGAGFVHGQTDPRTFFKNRIKLTDTEIQTIEKGQVVTKVLTSGDATYGILVFGGVYVNGSISKFAEVCRGVSKLQGEKVYLAVQEFSRRRTQQFPGFELPANVVSSIELQKLSTLPPDVFLFSASATMQEVGTWVPKLLSEPKSRNTHSTKQPPILD